MMFPRIPCSESEENHRTRDATVTHCSRDMKLEVVSADTVKGKWSWCLTWGARHQIMFPLMGSDSVKGDEKDRLCMVDRLRGHP